MKIKHPKVNKQKIKELRREAEKWCKDYRETKAKLDFLIASMPQSFLRTNITL